MAVAQGVPLQTVDDRAEAVVLQQQGPAGREPRGAFGERGALVREVHEPETGVDDDVRGGAGRRLGEPVRTEFGQPGAAVRARVLGDGAALGQHAVRDQALQRRGPLGGQRRRFEAQGLLGDVVGPDQLREPAPRAQPHPQRQQWVRAGGAGGGEQLAGGLLPQIQHQVTGGSPAEPAGDGRVDGGLEVGPGLGLGCGGHPATVSPPPSRPCTSRLVHTRRARAHPGGRVHIAQPVHERLALCTGATEGPSGPHYGGPVKVVQTELDGVLLFEPTPHRDARGFFSRTSDDAVLAAAGIDPTFPQDSQSRSVRGVVRGMHGRLGRGEAKLVRCAHGAVFDVVVDARPGSPTFGRWASFTLDDESMRSVYIPRGFLHGFQALTDVADTCYRIDAVHDPSEDVSVAFADPDLAIPWPLPPTLVSDRDRAAPSWRELSERLLQTGG